MDLDTANLSTLDRLVVRILLCLEFCPRIHFVLIGAVRCGELLQLADEMDDRIVDVIKGWSWVHTRDGPKVFLDSFEGQTHCCCVFRDVLFEFSVAEPIGLLLFVACVLSLWCDVVSLYFLD